jgi:hypothetical protein
MHAIEADNATLKGVLPKDFAAARTRPASPSPLDIGAPDEPQRQRTAPLTKKSSRA